MPSTYTDRYDGLTTSVAVKAPVRVATTANITLSATQTIDGVTVAVGDRVLVKDQTSAIDNGIWVVANGTWDRAEDFDGPRDCVSGTIINVTSGTVNANTSWKVYSADDPIVIGTSSLTLNASGNQGIYTATSSNTTVGTDDNGIVLLVDATGANKTVTLPSASSAGIGFTVEVMKADFSRYTVTLNAAGSDRIGYDGYQSSVSAAANNGSGLVRLTTTEQRNILTGTKILVAGVTSASGVFTATRINETTIDLQGSTYTSSTVSSATVTIVRTSVSLRVQDSHVTLVSNGSRWIIKSGSPDVWIGRDFVYGDNLDYAGPGTNNNTMRRVDMYYDSFYRRLHVPTIMVREIGDTPEIAMARSEGTYPDGTPTQVLNGTTVALWHGSGAIANGNFQSRCAQMAMKATEDQTQTASGGKIILSTATRGTTTMVDRLTVDQDGAVATVPYVLPTYTVATVPSASTYARGLIYVSNETGGAVPAFSDGTNWRRVTDRNVVS